MRPDRHIVSALAALALIPLLSSCGGGTGGTAAARPQSASSGAGLAAVRKPVRRPQVSATVHMMPGLETVIGANQADLTRQFGTPRLDVWENDARKLQFSGQACVLDVYLYPPAAGGAPLATYVDARRASDGKDVDRAACVAALKAR